MHVIGITGFIGSGKDAVADYIKDKYTYEHIDFGDITREFATEMGRTQSREDLQQIRRDFDEKYGKEFFAGEAVKIIKQNNLERVVITGFRGPEDVEPIKKKFGKDIIFIGIEADKKIRFYRLKKRNSPRDPNTFGEFQRQEENEYNLFPELKNIITEADYRIDNSGSIDDLHNNIDQFMKEHKLT